MEIVYYTVLVIPSKTDIHQCQVTRSAFRKNKTSKQKKCVRQVEYEGVRDYIKDKRYNAWKILAEVAS